jgi:hypothetical protein
MPPGRLCIGLDRSCWTEMKRDESLGEWTASLDSAMVPNGKRALQVYSDNRELRTEIAVDVQNPLQIYFANLHSHTSYSDGTLVPAVAHEYARDVAKLHVFCLTDHLETPSGGTSERWPGRPIRMASS